LAKSVSSRSQSEKLILRAYLSDKFPNTKEGLFSKGYVENRKGHKVQAKQIFEECVSKFPDFNIARDYYFGFLTDSNLIAADYLHILQHDIAFEDYGYLKYYYFLLANTFKNRQAADKMLDQYKQQVGDIFIFDFIKGMAFQNDLKDNNKALDFYKSAMKKDKVTWEVFQKTIDLELDVAKGKGYSNNEKVDILINYTTKYDSIKPSDPAMYEYIGDKLLNDFNAKEQAYAYYFKVFSLDPSSEIVEKIKNLGSELYINSYKKEESELFEKALQVMPDNFAFLEQYGLYLINKHDDSAKKYLEKSLKLSILRQDSVSVLLQLTTYYENQSFYDIAYSVYKKCNALVDSTSGSYGIVDYYIALNRAMEGDYQSAIQYLMISRDKKRSIKNVSEEHYKMVANDFESKLKLYTDRDNYLQNNSFQQSWFKRWGENCLFNFTYADNSIALNNTDLPNLKEAGAMLNSTEGQNYLILIRGLFKQGDTSLVTAQKRAKWIGKYLQDAFGIGAERIRYESVNLCKGCSVGGKSGFIEIIPTAKTTSPTQLITTTLPINGHIATSPDGKYIAVGTDPIQIWDLEKKIMVMELPSGSVRKFSPDGRYLAFTSSYTFPGGFTSYTLYIYDMKLRIMKRERFSDHYYGTFDWSPDGDKLALSSGQVIYIYDISKNVIEQQKYAADEEIRGLVWIRGKNVIVSGERVNDNVKIWDSKTLSLLANLNGYVEWTHAMGQTSDGKFLLVADNKRRLTRFDMTNWKATPLQTDLPVLGREIANEPFSHRVAISDWGGKEDDKIAIVNTDNGTIETLNGYEKVAGIAFAAGGKKLYREVKNKIEVINSRSLKLIDTISGYSYRGGLGFADTSRNYYLSVDANSVSVWDVTTGKKIHYWNIPLNVLIGINGGYLHGSKFYGVECNNRTEVSTLFEFDLDSFAVKELLNSSIRVQDADIDDKNIILCGVKSFSEGANRYTTDENGYAEVYDKMSLKKINAFSIQIPTERLVYDYLNDTRFTTVSSNNKGKLAVITSWSDGFGMGVTTSKEIRLYDIQSGEKIKSIPCDRTFDELNFSNDSTLAAINESFGWIFNTNTGEYKGYVAHGTTDVSYSFGAKGEKTLSKNYNILSFAGSGGGLKYTLPDLLNVSLFRKRNIAVTYETGNRIRFFGLNNFQEVITISNLYNNEWIAAKPSGQYESSLYGARNAYWGLGDNYLPITALRETFEVPKLIKTNLADIALLADVNSSSKGDTSLAISPALFQIPYECKINNFTGGPIYTQDSIYTVSVSVKRLDKKYSFPTVSLTRDGRYFDYTITPRKKEVTKDSMVIEFRVKVFGGTENNYEVVMNVLLGNNNADVILGKLLIKSTNLNTSYKPSLWYMGIGVTNYKNKSQDLQFADQDVYAVSSLLKKQENSMYSHVNTKIICNQSATIDSIKSGLWDFLMQAQDRDIIVIHVSGHGVLDIDDELYFVQYDGSMGSPEKSCFSIDEILKFLKSKRRPPNQKVLLLLDICHAGAFGNDQSKGATIDNTASGDDLIKKLSNGTGSIIIASSSGKQSSYESKDFGGGHGAFSYSIIEALSGLSPEKEVGRLYITELVNYVMSRVPGMVKKAGLGEQTPIANVEKFSDDFPVAKTSPHQ